MESPPVTNAARVPAKQRTLPHQPLVFAVITSGDRDAALSICHDITVQHGHRSPHLLDDWAKLASALANPNTTPAEIKDLLGPFITALDWQAR